MPNPITREEAAHYDEACKSRLAIPGIVLMTHAAVECASILRAECGVGPFLAICGGGNNGGDGYAIVRTLASHGLAAIALEITPPRPNSDAHTMREAARRMGLVAPWSSNLRRERDPANTPVIIDAIFGIGLDRPPTGAALEAIEWINAMGAAGSRVYAIDLPSGLGDASFHTSDHTPAIVRATRTLTMVAPKRSMVDPIAKGFVGEVTCVPIGGPTDPRSHLMME